MATAEHVKRALRKLADADRAQTTKGFFKTGEGQSAAGDVFLGVRVPEQRKVAREFSGLPLGEVVRLLKSRVHEDRLTAVLIFVQAYQSAKKDDTARREVVEAYLANLSLMSGWDIVDSGAPKILGHWLLSRDRGVLFELIQSRSLWVRRVAMVATQELIRNGQAEEAFRLAELCLSDPEDLMHKAAGWMLREAGEKVSIVALRQFLRKHASRMPRPMLRGAIEKLPPAERSRWLQVGKS